MGLVEVLTKLDTHLKDTILWGTYSYLYKQLQINGGPSRDRTEDLLIKSQFYSCKLLNYKSDF